MTRALTGKRIVLAASRKTEEMSELIHRQGGISIIRPLQGIVFPADKEIEPDVSRFVGEGADWVIFTTGIGMEALLEKSAKMGILSSFLEVIKQAKVASRGYKTFSALKQLGISPIAKDNDGTSRGLVRAMEPFDLAGKRVMVQLHGETAPTLMRFLNEKGASVRTLLPYLHIAPETETVEGFCLDLIQGQVDAVCFTTAIQVRSLFDYAKKHGYVADVKSAFEGEVLAVAVGKVTREALWEEGIGRVIAPDHERMGAMIVELSHYYKKHGVKGGV